MLKLADFELPGDPGVHGDVIYTSANEDPHTMLLFDNRKEDIYLLTGFLGGEDGSAGVLIKGTQYANPNVSRSREIRILRAPDDETFEVRDTEFYWAESISDFIVRVCGCYTVKASPEARLGFMYEGPMDGSGDWYPVQIPGAEETVVRGCRYGAVIADPIDGSDELHVLCLRSNEWTKIHLGYAADWALDSIIEIDNIYTISGTFSDGKEFSVKYEPPAAN